MSTTTAQRPATARQPSSPSSGKPSIRAIQIVLGAIWIIAGALQYQPFMFSKDFLTSIIQPVAQGQPGWVGTPMDWAVHVMSHHLILYNALFATIQTLIGFGLLFRRTIKVALVGSFVWVVLVWWFGEGFGMIPMGMASALTGAPGAVIIYGIIGALVWPEKTEETGEVRAPRWAPAVGRLAWAVLWCSSAAFWLLPANRGATSFHDQVQGAAYGWLGGVQSSIARASDGHGLGIAIGLAVASILIGLGVFVPAAVRPVLVAGIVLSLAYWAFGQGFGTVTTGQATDVNAGPLYVLLALRLWSDPVRINWGWARSTGGTPVGTSVVSGSPRTRPELRVG